MYIPDDNDLSRSWPKSSSGYRHSVHPHNITSSAPSRVETGLEHKTMSIDMQKMFTTIFFTCMELPETVAGPPMTSKAVIATGVPIASPTAAAFIIVFTTPIVEHNDHYQQAWGGSRLYSAR